MSAGALEGGDGERFATRSGSPRQAAGARLGGPSVRTRARVVLGEFGDLFGCLAELVEQFESPLVVGVSVASLLFGRPSQVLGDLVERDAGGGDVDGRAVEVDAAVGAAPHGGAVGVAG